MPSKPEVLKERRKNDPEYAARVRGYSKKWRESNPERTKELNRIKAVKKRDLDREAYNAYMREWTEKNKDRLNAARRERLKNDPEYAEKQKNIGKIRYAKNPDKHRNVRLKSVYGITLEEYQKMYDEQNGECFICNEHKESCSRGGLVVDHCHKKGNVRKLLCPRCNKGLGHFKDDVNLLQKAIDYLTKQ